MSKIVFVQEEFTDKLGPMLLCACLKEKGHAAEIIVNPRHSIGRIRMMNPDFIGMSVLSASVGWPLSTCRWLKQLFPNALTILGGPHPTYFPEIIEEEGVDLICRGEGEKLLLRLMESYDGSIASIDHTPGLWIKKDGAVIRNDVCDLLTEKELSELPFCDRTYYSLYPQLRNNPHKTILTSRGCPNSCAYCFNYKFKELYRGHGNLVRQRTVDSVIRELQELKKYGWKCLEICDDQFILSRQWIFDFCERYKSNIDMPFSCLTSAKQLTPDIVAALKRAGCTVIHFAIECGVEKYRRHVYNKPITDGEIYAAAEALRSNDMPFLTFNMVGLPDETPADIYKTIEMNQKIDTPYPWCSIVQPYPGTNIAEHMRKNGINVPSKFGPTFFQSTCIENPVQRKLVMNSQRLFGFMVKNRVNYNNFCKMVINPPLGIDTVYPLVFYWYYGRSLRRRHRMTFAALFRYWLYSLSR